MTALERGQILMLTPMSQLPPLALAHLKYLTNKIGMCIEVCLTVYTVYAQIVEGLECNDELYFPDQDSINWYEGADYHYKGKVNTLSSK